MLCPKCGRMSFDNLTSCSKCQHDLSAIQAQLRGTAIQAEKCFFLTSALSAGDSDDSVDNMDLADIATPDTPTADNIPEQEEPSAGQVVDFEDILTPELSEIVMEANNSDDPELADAEVIVPQAQKNAEPAEPQPEKIGIEPLESLGKKAQTAPEKEHTLTNNMAAPQDTESLILEINDAKPDNQSESRDNGQIPIDLEQIDLSDLLHPPQQTPQDSPGAEKPAAHQDNKDLPDLRLESSSGAASPEFDFDDLTLERVPPANEPADLGLEMDKTNSQDNNPEPIDLTQKAD
ncbi:MAG: hypothetical protein GXP59_04440 [Deltaproteobacteria bacterium]|nr:hypothetical protein [Deltaproteobacteria bacterium]